MRYLESFEHWRRKSSFRSTESEFTEILGEREMGDSYPLGVCGHVIC